MKKMMYVVGLLPVLLFVWIGFNLESEFILSFDTKIAGYLFGNEFITMFHYIGDTGFVMIVTILMVLYFGWKQANYRAALFIVATVAGGTTINQSFKALYARPRPELIDQLESFSYPSGHSMLGALYLLTLAYLLGKLLGDGKMKVVYFAVCISLFVLIGLSRIAEGRHFASDVIGGWSLGIVWFTLCVMWYDRRESLFRKRRN